MTPNDTEIKQVVYVGLKQLPVIALRRVRKEILDNPEMILMDGRVFSGECSKPTY